MAPFDDATVIQRLKASHAAVCKVAVWLSKAKGEKVIIPPLLIRPSRAEIAAYRDKGDLQIVRRVEVKQMLNTPFTGPEDWPHEDDDGRLATIVDEVVKIDRHPRKAYAYVIVNPPATVAMVIKGHTSPLWTKGWRPDSVAQEKREFYFCALEHCDFHEIGEIGGEDA